MSSPEPEEPLPPLPTKIRFDARYKDVPRARKDLSLWLFLGTIIVITACGWRGLWAIGRFLDLTKRSMELRARATPRPPSPDDPVEIRFEPAEKAGR